MPSSAAVSVEYGYLSHKVPVAWRLLEIRRLSKYVRPVRPDSQLLDCPEVVVRVMERDWYWVLAMFRKRMWAYVMMLRLSMWYTT